MNEYALYQGDTFVTIGTLDQISDFLGVKRGTAKFYASKCNRKRNPNGRMLIKIEVDDEG